MCFSLQVGEVVLHARITVLVVARISSNFLVELVRLHSQGLDLLFVGLHNLSLDDPVELKILDDSLLLLHVDGGILKSLGVLFDLALKRGLLRDGHAELGELEKDLEVGEEGNHLGGGAWVAHRVQQRALLAISVLIDAGSDILQPVAVHIGGHAVLDGLGERLGGCEDGIADSCVRSIGVLLDEPADSVDNIATGADSGALAAAENGADFLETVLVAALEELGLGLGHALDQLLDITELLRGSLLELLLLLILGLEHLKLSVRVIVLLLDLFGEKQTAINTSASLR